MPTSELDAFVRHQVYLEGYKNHEAEKQQEIVNEIILLIVLMLNRSGVETLGELTKKQLGKLLSDIGKALSKVFNKLINVTTKSLYEFMSADLSINKFLFKNFTTETIKTPTIAKLWAGIQNQLVPGVGLDPKGAILTYVNNVKAKINVIIRKGYVDNLKLQEVIRQFTGLKIDNYAGSLYNLIGSQLGALIETLIQNISSYITYFLGAIIGGSYQWISVLDSRTTDICRSRNGNIYVYGEGPRPPAHFRCRSHIMPVFVTKVPSVPTYYAWLVAQPLAVQNDLLGQRRAQNLRAGNIKADDLPTFDGTKSLTLDEFQSKRNLMIAA